MKQAQCFRGTREFKARWEFVSTLNYNIILPDWAIFRRLALLEKKGSVAM